MTTIFPQAVGDISSITRALSGLIKPGFSLTDSISRITNTFERGAVEELDELKKERWALGLVYGGTTPILGSYPTGEDGDSPIPGLTRYDTGIDDPVFQTKVQKDNAVKIKKRILSPFVHKGVILNPIEYDQLQRRWYGFRPLLQIRSRLIASGDLPPGYSAENIRKLINPPIGFGKPSLPVGWTELIAVREGFSGEIAIAKGRLHAAALNDRGADDLDRKILSTKIKNAALIARESKQASNDIQRITSGVPVGIN